MKKILLIIVDACSSRVVIPAMERGLLPNLQALTEIGTLKPESIAIFPSLTPAATASLVTGEYPCQHNILGFHWYDLEEDRVIYYGDDFWVIWNESFEAFFKDFLKRLNHQRLHADTLFQVVERSGLKAASLNYLIFRGNVEHKADVPLLLSLLPGIPFSEEVYGPSIMYFGDLVDSEIEIGHQTLSREGGLFHRFGFDDENTANLLLQLAEKRVLTDFTLAYFPDNDFRSHDLGPEKAVTALEDVDTRLGELFSLYGGIEQFLAEFCLVLTGDHSQSNMLDDKETAAIQLDELLADFSIAEPGKSWEGDDQLIVCPDMRSAQLYFRTLTSAKLEQVIKQLLRDDRIDQLIWRAKDLDHQAGWYVASGDRGRLRFWPVQEGPNTVRDQYGCFWNWEGDLETVDGVVSDNEIRFPGYPNAFERIVGALDSKNSGHLWLTAHPGYEFQIAETSIHLGGGSHGSLHALDSISPLIVAGAPKNLSLPAQPRAVDITPLCLSILGLKSNHSVGDTHIRPW
jgi:hypothetical protein